MNKKIILWAVAAFLAGGAFAAWQNIINNQKGQPQSTVEKKTAETKPPVASLQPPKPQDHQVRVILIAQMPKDGNARDIGCGNTTKPMIQKSTFQSDPVKDALKVLLGLTRAGYENGELYNALYQSNLKVQSVERKVDIVTIKLTGNIKLGGECDIPRVKEQLIGTIKAASKAKKILVFINDKKLEDAVILN